MTQPKKYWKPTTPEQIADFKARRRIANKKAKDKIKLNTMGILTATRMPRLPMTIEERRLRHNELQNAKRAKEKADLGETTRVYTKTVKRVAVVRVPAPIRVKQEEVRLPDRVQDPNKVKVRLDRRTEVFASPGYDIVQLRAKYGIAI